MSALEFGHVSYRYPEDDFDIIDDLSFSVEPGSFHCVVGVSGCGKSTVLRLTCGLLRPKSGTIRINGAPIQGQSRCCGYMPQRDLLFPWRTVGENLALPLEIRGGYTKAQRRELAEAALEDVGLAGCAGKFPGELSGGMRQRAALIRTLVLDPDILLLDEPFSALDYQTRLSVCDDIGQILRNAHKTAVLVTHDLSEAVSMADRVVVLTPRPASIAKIIPITFELEADTPMNRRNAPEFKHYFNIIWKELNTNA